MNKSKAGSDDKNTLGHGTKENTLLDDKKMTTLAMKIETLSYEDSLKELDLILGELQNESILVEELKFNYVKAKLYLQHCETLLERTEQEVIKIDTLN